MHISETAAPKISTDRQGPRWKRRKDARPQEVLDAALMLFAQHGYAQTRLDDVATKAGISKGTVYLYYNSKQDLFEAVVHDRATPWLEAVSGQTIDDNDSTETVLRNFLQWGWKQFLESRLHMIARVVLAESNNFPHLSQAYLKEVMDPIHDHLIGLLERGVARGEVRGNVTRERAQALLAPLAWLSLWRQALLSYGEHPLNESVFLNETIDMVIHSVTGGNALD